MKHWPWAIPLLVVGLYWGHMWQGTWVYEDARMVLAITKPLSFGGLRPLARATWRLTPTPQAAHAFSVGIHLAVIALLGALAWRLGYSEAGVGLVALLGAVHPLTVESVAYATARSELLAALGVLVALVCAAGRWWRPWAILGMVAGAAFGLLGKESAVVVLGLVPLTIWVRRRAAPKQAYGYGALALFLVILAAVAVDGREIRTIINLGEVGDMRVQWFPWLLLQSAAAFTLIGQSLSGVGISVDADIDLIPTWMRWFAFTGLCGVAVLVWAVRKSRPLVAYGLAWALVCILPRLIVQTPRSYMNPHQAYLMLHGLILAAVAWWDRDATL